MATTSTPTTTTTTTSYTVGASSGEKATEPNLKTKLTAKITPAASVQEQGMVKSWGGKPYEQDTFPAYFSEEGVRKLQARCRGLPEEFYSKSSIEVVTPDSLETWFAVHKDIPRRWILQER